MDNIKSMFGSRKGKPSESPVMTIDPYESEPQPSATEVSKQFDSLLSELGIQNGPKKEEMMSWDSNRKWELVVQNKRKVYMESRMNANKGNPKKVTETPEFFVGAIKSHPNGNLNVLRRLRVNLGSSMISWLQHFLQLGGLETLVAQLATIELKSKKSPKDLHIIYECVLSIKSLLNHQAGLVRAMEIPKTIQTVTLVLSLNSLDLPGSDKKKPANREDAGEFDRFLLAKVLTAVMDILCAVALVSQDGHRIIMDALNNYGTTAREKRFLVLVRCLVNGLKNAKSAGSNEEFYSHLVSGVAVINTVVNGPDELRVRSLLRNEFFQLGLEGIMKEFQKIKSNELKIQLDTFFGVMADDTQEMEEKFNDVQDPQEMMQQIIKNIAHSENYKYFLSVLGNMAIVAAKPEEEAIRAWKQFDDMVNRVMFKEFPGDLVGLDKNHLQSIVGTDVKVRAGAGAGFGRTISVSNFANYKQASAKAKERETMGGAVPVDVTGKPTASAKTPASEPAPSFVDPSEDEIDYGIDGEPDFSDIEVPKIPNEPAATPEQLPRASVKLGGARASVMGQAPVNATPPQPGGEEVGKPDAGPPNFVPMAPGMPPPPPPPAMGGPPVKPKFLPNKNPVIASCKMRQMMLRKIPEFKLENTFWLKVRESELGNNFALLEEYFSAQELKRGSLAHTEEDGSRPSVMHVIDAKKSNNISVLLSHVKLPPHEIRRAIADMDERRIDLVTLEQMVKYLPTDEEVDALRNFPQQDYMYLDRPEQYILEILQVPQLQARLEAWLFKRNFVNLFADIAPSLGAVKQAIQQIKKSTSLASLLEIVLTLINFMNGARGTTYGFKLDTLLKIKDTKTADNKTTLLHFMATMLQSSFPDIWKFYSDMPALDDARKINMLAVKDDIANLKKGFEKVEFALSEISPDDRYYGLLSSFMAGNKPDFQRANDEFLTVEHEFKALIEYFGEDPMSTEEFFGLFHRFNTALNTAYLENERKKEAEIRARQVEERRQNMVAKAKAARAAAGELDDGDGAVEDVVDALHSSNMLRVKRDNVRAGVLFMPPQAILDFRKNLKRTSFYDRNNIQANLITDPDNKQEENLDELLEGATGSVAPPQPKVPPHAVAPALSRAQDNPRSSSTSHPPLPTFKLKPVAQQQPIASSPVQAPAHSNSPRTHHQQPQQQQPQPQQNQAAPVQAARPTRPTNSNVQRSNSSNQFGTLGRPTAPSRPQESPEVKQSDVKGSTLRFPRASAPPPPDFLPETRERSSSRDYSSDPRASQQVPESPSYQSPYESVQQPAAARESYVQQPPASRQPSMNQDSPSSYRESYQQPAAAPRDSYADPSPRDSRRDTYHQYATERESYYQPQFEDSADYEGGSRYSRVPSQAGAKKFSDSTLSFGGKTRENSMIVSGSAIFDQIMGGSTEEEYLYEDDESQVSEMRSQISFFTTNINLNLDLLKLQGESLFTHEEGMPILVRIRGLMPATEKLKVYLSNVPQIDKSALSKSANDKLARVQAAISVFATEIQAILNAVTDEKNGFADSSLPQIVELLQEVEGLCSK